MGKLFSPRGIKSIMDTLDTGILKKLLTSFELPDCNGVTEAIYREYLNNSTSDKWYKCCTLLHDIDLVAYHNPEEGANLRQQIIQFNREEDFERDCNLPGSTDLLSIIAWIALSIHELWVDYAQEAYNKQIEFGGTRHYLGEPLAGKAASEEERQRREDEFKKSFAEYLTATRSKVENVHVEFEPFGSQVRFVVYFDPFPKNQNEFDKNGALKPTPNHAVEHLSILYKQGEKHPFITVKSKDLTSEQDTEIARFFIETYLGFNVGARPTERYDLTPFNRLTKQLDTSDEDLACYRFSSITIQSVLPDGNIEENTHKCVRGSVYDCCRPYYESKSIPLNRRVILRLRIAVTVYVGAKPPMQESLFGSEIPSKDRPAEEYDVDVTSHSRHIRNCKDEATRQTIERILNNWGLRDLNDVTTFTRTER